jgi:hypothetical protein
MMPKQSDFQLRRHLHHDNSLQVHNLNPNFESRCIFHYGNLARHCSVLLVDVWRYLESLEASSSSTEVHSVRKGEVSLRQLFLNNIDFHEHMDDAK